MKVKMRATGSYLFHEKWIKPGDIIEGTTSEYDWLRGADCAVKMGMVEDEVIETQMVDTEQRTENRMRGKRK